MRSFLSTAVAAALLLTPAAAQTFTNCDPLKKKCPADVGLNQKHYEIDFTKTQGKKALARWTETARGVTFDGKGARFAINKRGDSPTIQSNFYIHYGKVEVDMWAAPGQGVVSSVVLQSDDRDEIDWEFIGNDHINVQSNFYGKGNTTTYDRGAFHPLPGDPMLKKYRYTFDWTKERMTWAINGKVKRTVRYGDPLAVYGKNFPQTPMNVRLGIWAGGDPANSPGTIEWAGGPINYGAGPYAMHIARVAVTNYNPAPGYKYSDKSGSSRSIRKLKSFPKHNTNNSKKERSHAKQIDARDVPTATYVPPPEYTTKETSSDYPTETPTTITDSSIPPYPTGPSHTPYYPGTGFPGTGYTTKTTSKTTSKPTVVTSTYTDGGSTYTSVRTPTGPASAPPSSSPSNAAGAVNANVGGAVLGLIGAVAML